MAIEGPETGRPAGRARRDPAAQRRTGRATFLPREEGRQAGEESRASGCGSRTGFGQISPLRGRARLVRCRRDGWSLPPEPRRPVTPVVGIMPPMSAQPLRHERFAQTPPLQSRLDLPALDKLKPGRRTPTRRTPKPASEPQLSYRDSTRDHRQGGTFDRLEPVAGLARDPQQQIPTPGGLHCDEPWRRSRPKGPVHPRTRA